jgi:hypothetical protein
MFAQLNIFLICAHEQNYTFQMFYWINFRTQLMLYFHFISLLSNRHVAMA